MVMLLKESDVRDLLPMEECIEILEGVFEQQGLGRVVNRPRYRTRTEKGFLHIMPAAVPALDGLGFKAYTSYGGVPKNLMMLYSYQNGQLLAMIESGWLSSIRTGAATGVATKYMARKDAKVVGIYGTGGQALTQLPAICAVREVSKVLAYSRDVDRRESFCKKMSESLGVEVISVEKPEEAAKGVDIIVTATTSRDPVCKGEWMDKGVHINAIGSNHWIRREVDDVAISRSDIIIADDVENSKIEAGELIWAVERGLMNWGQVFELGDVVVGRVVARKGDDDITMFKSNGVAIEDVAVAMRLYQKARDKGVGEELPI